MPSDERRDTRDDGLDDSVHRRITDLCEQAGQFQDEQRFPDALRALGEAFNLLPAPQMKWEASTWILTAMGDVHFLSGEYAKGVEKLQLAVLGPGGLGNPFIHLRLGQCNFELGNQKRADDELTRAYMGAGREIFQAEDAKYLERLKDILIPPAGRDEL
jgi:hypothetical protein